MKKGIMYFVLGMIVASGFFMLFKFSKRDNLRKNEPPAEKFVERTIPKTDSGQKDDMPDTQPAAPIKNIGFNLDLYDPATQRAGDIQFFKIKMPYDRLFYDYGHVETIVGQGKANLHPTFILPLGTPVRAMISGVVVGVPKLYSGDYSVQMTVDGQMDGLIFELEHVKKPIVKVGDKVTPGQVVAEVTDFGGHNYPGYGSVDIAVFHAGEGGQPEHLCPFLYLDASIKDEVGQKIQALYKSWEEYMGKDMLYDEANHKIPGCIITDPIEG